MVEEMSGGKQSQGCAPTQHPLYLRNAFYFILWSARSLRQTGQRCPGGGLVGACWLSVGWLWAGCGLVVGWWWAGSDLPETYSTSKCFSTSLKSKPNVLMYSASVNNLAFEGPAFNRMKINHWRLPPLPPNFRGLRCPHLPGRSLEAEREGPGDQKRAGAARQPGPAVQP